MGTTRIQTWHNYDWVALLCEITEPSDEEGP